MPNSQPAVYAGFIVHGFVRSIRGVPTLCLVGRGSDHQTFAILISQEHPSLYLRTSDLGAARAHNLRVQSPDRTFRTMDGEECIRVSFDTERKLRDAASRLRREGVRTYEADVDVVDAYLMDRGIHGTIAIRGESEPGRHVDRVFFDPALDPADWQPQLSVLSVDIETTTTGDPHILVIGYELRAPWIESPLQEVLYTSIPEFGKTGTSEIGSPFTARYCENEASLLQMFFARLVELDPDIITGWNVVDFDWKIIATRATALGVEPRIGRSDEPARYLPPRRRGGDRHTDGPSDEDAELSAGARPLETATMFIPGRQVIDGIRLLRYGPQNFREQSLQFVANQVLGTGKTIAYESSADKLRQIERLSREDPEALCRYCLQDAVLVQQILAKTGLMDLTVMRCVLIGVSLSRAWMSIRSFDFIYIEAMHRRAVVAPTLGVDALEMGAAPGGAILTPEAGVFEGVMVFDFKSLYPSVIRTFNIDPVGRVSVRGSRPDPSEYIVAPNGAAFSREPGILPELLDRFFEAREAAKKRGDTVASYVYKIVMNSFYGVLGASGCRFAGVQLAGAITSLGQRVLRWCKRLLVDEGYPVIYGDTDSLFVLSRNPGDIPGIFREGSDLVQMVNARLAEFVRTEYGVPSRLELEFEKVYSRFFLPALRTQTASESAADTPRGRAKGYAGLIADRDGSSVPVHERIEIKGMEAVRRDWTPLAQKFQVQILATLFEAGQLEERTQRLSVEVRALVRRLRAGEFDDDIVYTRGLRKTVSDYTRSQPPHVKAALLLPPAERHGLIRYVMTVEGPQPVERLTAPIDYDHYVEKQLRPIAQAFVDSLGPEIADALNRDRQLPLFGA